MPAEARVLTEEADPIEKLVREGAYREAAARCAREHGAAIGRLCMALLGAQSEAEEAVQETLLAAHDGMASFRADGSVKAWLFGIARRICARRLTTRTREKRRLHLVPVPDSANELPDDLVDRRRSAQEVRAALERLRPTDRDALVLRYQAGLSHREIAAACGLDEATARKRASRALGRLAAILEERRRR